MAAYFTYKRQVNLLPGQTLAFTAGKGYYAKPGGAPAPYPGGGPAEPKSGAGGNPYAPPVRPRPPAPAPPPPSPPVRPPVAADPYAALSQAEIDRRATALANSGLDPQAAEIRRQQALATTNARADEGAIQGFQTASADLMGKLGPQAEDGFLRASQEEGALGQGMATGVQGDLTARVAADQAFAQSQGQSGGSTVDPAAAHDVLYGLNGQIPGDTFAEQGAAMNKWGLAQAPIALNAGREELDARQAKAREENDGYATQLIQLAQQFPGEKAKALAQLNQYELDKANYREGVVNDKANRAHVKLTDKQNQQDLNIRARSERAQELASGVNAANDKSALAYKWASLEFQSAKERDRAKAAVKAAAAKGQRPNSALSKAYGHIVDANGNAILDRNGKEIPVVKGTSSAAQTVKNKGLVNRAKATSHASTTAFNYATKLLGAPVKAPKGSKGAYVASPKFAAIAQGKPGAVFPPSYPGGPATTNRPGRANRAGGASNYEDAATKVWAEIDGDGLMARYAYSREQVMAIVNKALKAAGWKRK